MSLAIYAAPFNENSNNLNNLNNDNNNNDIIQEKRQHNKTQKNYYKESFKTKPETFDQNKVNSVLEQLHLKTEDDDEMKENNNFNPPPKPESSGVERTITNENMQNMLNENNLNMYKVLGKAPQPNYESNDNLDLNNFNSNYGDSKSVEEYYKKVLPSYSQPKNPNNKQYYNNESTLYSGNNNQDILLQKLNYMINLLEEKQDEKTNNVTEEVVLYSFLGIFIIFIVDSFARVGKYIR